MKKLFFILLSVQLLFASTTEKLRPSEAIDKTIIEKEKQYFKITVPKNKSVRVNLTELKADVYLYVKKGNNVRFRFNDCYSSLDDSLTQECVLTNDGETSVYSILVYATETSLYSIKATIEKSEEIQVLGTKAIQDAVEYKKSKQYKIPVKKGKLTTVTLSDLSADADLRVKLGRKAALNTFDCKSSKGGTKVDECKITPKKDGTLFIQVYGYKEASYSITVSEKTNNTPISLEKLKKMIENNEDVTKVNTSEITSMSNLFLSNKSFNQDISKWDVSHVTDMSRMFFSATSFNQNIGSWDVSNVKYMIGMFKNATTFNQDISKWNVSKVTNMNNMFYNTASFSNHDLSKWDVANVVTKDNFADGVGDGNKAPKFKIDELYNKLFEKAKKVCSDRPDGDKPSNIVCPLTYGDIAYMITYKKDIGESTGVTSTIYAINFSGHFRKVNKIFSEFNYFGPASITEIKGSPHIAIEYNGIQGNDRNIAIFDMFGEKLLEKFYYKYNKELQKIKEIEGNASTDYHRVAHLHYDKHNFDDNGNHSITKTVEKFVLKFGKFEEQ